MPDGEKIPSYIHEVSGYVLPDEVNRLPEDFGVYIMKNAQDAIIYIGKAINLKKRVSSYFQNRRESRGDIYNQVKTKMMAQNVAIIDYILVTNEVEALLLESNLIKHYQPKYNVTFKDNKFYPSIKVTVGEAFPRILFTREQKKDGSVYFGPYPSAAAVRTRIDLVQRVCMIRTCGELPKQECLNYHIQRCSAPCIEKISPEEYRESVSQAIDLLSGDFTKIIESLQGKMQNFAKNLLFEKAQEVKEKLEAVRLFESGQSVILDKSIHADFVGFASKLGKYLFVVSIIRGGKMVGKRSFTANLKVDEEENELLEGFILEYWQNSDGMAERIVLEKKHQKYLRNLNDYFRGNKNKVRISAPKSPPEKSLSHMAYENAVLHLAQVLSKVDEGESLKELQEVLSLPELPLRIEGFDIANILGQNAVASLVSFYGGKPDKKNYRHFKIKSLSTPDDFAMIAEAVTRRYRRLVNENLELPDLVLIDGGRGQLNAALGALNDLGVNLNVISLAKQHEEIYTPHLDKPIVLPKNSRALHVLQRVRDETHRFANSFYNKLKGIDLIESAFDGIEGIGKKRKQIIVQKFLNYDIIKELNIELIIKAGIPESVAGAVLEKLKALVQKEESKIAKR